MSLRLKLFLIIGMILVSVTGGTSWIFLGELEKAEVRLQSLYRDAVLPMDKAIEIDSDIDQLKTILLEWRFSSDLTKSVAAFAHKHEELHAHIDRYIEDHTLDNQPDMQALLRKYQNYHSQAEREKSATAEIVNGLPLVETLARAKFDLLEAGKSDEAVRSYQDIAPVFDRMIAAADVLIDLHVEQGEISIRDNAVERAKAMRTFLSVVAIALLLGLFSIFLMASVMLRPLKRLEEGLAEIGKGNYAALLDASGRDEFARLARSFNAMVGQLREAWKKLDSYGSKLEDLVAQRTRELEQIKASLETSVAERTEELRISNERLMAQANDLSRHNQEMILFDEANELLQACATEQEAYAIVARTAENLFKPHAGALYLINSSRDLLETAAAWGSAPPPNPTFRAGECWALRRGQSHICTGTEIRCAHVRDPTAHSACIPLIGQGETLGILHLTCDASGNYTEHELADTCRMAKNLAEHLGLAVANLKLRDAMRNMSIHDALTGLYNRRYLDEALAQELGRARRNDQEVAVIMFDVDHFKAFNDSFGHQAGDAVLRELGRFVKSSIRPGDLGCRYGGEEFAVILSPSTLGGAMARAEELRQGVKLLSTRNEKQPLGQITISLGVAVFPLHAADPKTLMNAADLALYEAKHSGRDCVVAFKPKPGQGLSTKSAAA